MHRGATIQVVLGWELGSELKKDDEHGGINRCISSRLETKWKWGSNGTEADFVNVAGAARDRHRETVVARS